MFFICRIWKCDALNCTSFETCTGITLDVRLWVLGQKMNVNQVHHTSDQMAL